MDFHGLARKELQALCKQNKIPANMTNVAMADALSALHHVDGLEEMVQQRGLGSEVAGSAASGSSRAWSSRKVGSGDLVEEDEMKKVESTPVVGGGRKRGGAASSRRKVEVSSVQRVYSTRRSVRLIEKKLSELCLKDSVRRTRAIKIDDELSSGNGMCCFDDKGDGVKMDHVLVPGECNEKVLENDTVEAEGFAVKDSQDSNVATVKEAEGEDSTSNNGMADVVAAIEGEQDVNCVKDVVVVEGAADNAAMESVVEIAAMRSVKKVFNNGMADVAPVEEVVKSISEDFEKDVVMENAETESIGAADLAVIEEVEKPIFKDCAKDDDGVKDIVSYAEIERPVMADVAAAIEGVENAAISDAGNGNNGIGMADVAANEELEKVMIGMSATDTKRATPEKSAEQKLAAYHSKGFGSDSEHDLGAKLEGSIETSADNVQTDIEVTNIGNETDKHVLPSLAVWDSEVTSAKKNVLNEDNKAQTTPVAMKGSLSAKTITTISAPGNSPHLQAQLSTKKSAFKEAHAVTEDINKENNAVILKIEESCQRPALPYQGMSYRKLVKKLKELTVINKEMSVAADADTHLAKEHHAVTPRKALQTIPDNTKKH